MLTRKVNRRFTCSMVECFDGEVDEGFVVAVRPVVAAEPGPGEPHRGTA